MKIFPKNPAVSLLCLYGPLTSCKISEKTNEPIDRKVCYRRTDELTDGGEFIGSFTASRDPKIELNKEPKKRI